MNTATIDNSDAGYIERTILWQYDNATNLKSIILSFKNFFDRSTKDHFDELIGRLNLASDDIDDYGLAVWGKLLNTSRPELEFILDGAESETVQPMSKDLYRRILLAKLRLLDSDASTKSYIDYLNTVFDGDVKLVDGLDMAITFEIAEDATLTNEEVALINQRPDVVFLYPAGVRSSEHSTSNMFCLAEYNAGDVVDGETLMSATGQPTETEFNVGGLDESGFNWRLTAKGNWR